MNPTPQIQLGYCKSITEAYVTAKEAGRAVQHMQKALTKMNI
jgi:hypothetical protein